MPEGLKPPKRLEVRSSTLVSGPSLVTEPGTRDVMARVGSDTQDTMARVGSDTQDTMPQARPADQSPLDRTGPRVVSEHYSWKALSQPSPSPPSTPSEMMAGAGMTEMGDHNPMPGAVRKNKAPF
jgi:hypothetical protein